MQNEKKMTKSIDLVRSLGTNLRVHTMQLCLSDATMSVPLGTPRARAVRNIAADHKVNIIHVLVYRCGIIRDGIPIPLNVMLALLF